MGDHDNGNISPDPAYEHYLRWVRGNEALFEAMAADVHGHGGVPVTAHPGNTRPLLDFYLLYDFVRRGCAHALSVRDRPHEILDRLLDNISPDEKIPHDSVKSECILNLKNGSKLPIDLDLHTGWIFISPRQEGLKANSFEARQTISVNAHADPEMLPALIRLCNEAFGGMASFKFPINDKGWLGRGDTVTIYLPDRTLTESQKQAVTEALSPFVRTESSRVNRMIGKKISDGIFTQIYPTEGEITELEQCACRLNPYLGAEMKGFIERNGDRRLSAGQYAILSACLRSFARMTMPHDATSTPAEPAADMRFIESLVGIPALELLLEHSENKTLADGLGQTTPNAFRPSLAGGLYPAIKYNSPDDDSLTPDPGRLCGTETGTLPKARETGNNLQIPTSPPDAGQWQRAVRNNGNSGRNISPLLE